MATTEVLQRDAVPTPAAIEVVNHPFFSRSYPRFAVKADERGQAEHRAELLTGASGRVVEVGAGTGRNFRHYPSSVRELIAVEPEPRLRELAEAEAETVPIDVRVVDGVASALPLPDGSCDVGIASLVLCSVTDQERTLAELYRVIRPGGELRFSEHVAAPDGLAHLQRLADRLFWPKLGGGCHCARDTLAAIETAGFEIQACRGFRFKASPLLGVVSAPHVLGLARRR